MASSLPQFRAAALSHAYLIPAPPQAGLAAALTLARAMLCTAPDPARRPCGLCRDCRKAERGVHPDILTVERARDDKGRQKREIYVDQIRDLVADSVVLPNEAERKVYLICDADTMNGAAQNALLKLLEEPPAFVFVILIAASADALLETVRSRCVTLRVPAEDPPPPAEARALAERFLDLCAARAKVSLLTFANVNADLGNAELLDFARAAQLLLTDMLCARLPDLRMERARLMRLLALMQRAEEYLRFNVSAKHVLGLLAVDGAK